MFGSNIVAPVSSIGRATKQIDEAGTVLPETIARLTETIVALVAALGGE